jgi:Zn-dependent protease
MDFQARLQMMTIQIVPFFAAIVFHEFGHGWMAKKWGDRTATDAGRLTLNPIAHIDPIGTVMIPMLNMITGFPFFFGWAKPVPINPNRFRKYRPGLFMVSLAGPFSNILLAFVSAIGLIAFIRFSSPDFALREPLQEMLKVGVQINFMLAFFNLLPLPPLDGAKIVESFSGPGVSQAMAQLERYSFFILLGLLWFNLLSFLETPVVQSSNFAITVAARLFGLAL